MLGKGWPISIVLVFWLAMRSTCSVLMKVSVQKFKVTVWIFKADSVLNIISGVNTYLLDIIFYSDVWWMHKGSHNFYIAMDHQGFIRSVCVDANSAMVKDSVRELRALPKYITVTLKLTWVRSLQKRHPEKSWGLTVNSCKWLRKTEKKSPVVLQQEKV